MAGSKPKPTNGGRTMKTIDDLTYLAREQSRLEHLGQATITLSLTMEQLHQLLQRAREGLRTLKDSMRDEAEGDGYTQAIIDIADLGDTARHRLIQQAWSKRQGRAYFRCRNRIDSAKQRIGVQIDGGGDDA